MLKKIQLIAGNLVNKKDIQAEGNVTIGKDATNQEDFYQIKK